MFSCLGLQSTELEGRRLGLLGLQPRPSRWELMKKACYLAGPRKAMSSSTSRLKSSTSLAPPTQQPWWNFFAGTPWGLKGICSGRGARAPPAPPLDPPLVTRNGLVLSPLMSLSPPARGCGCGCCWLSAPSGQAPPNPIPSLG